MKKLQENINKALVESGFSVSEKITRDEYLALADEEKEKFDRDWSNNVDEVYYRESVDPELADEDTDKVQSLLLYRKLSDISDSVKTIKHCMLFFTVLTVIALIGYFAIAVKTANELSNMRF